MAFPKQPDVLAYRSVYGDPRGRNGLVNETWRKASLVSVPVPYAMAMGDIPIKRIYVHKACAASLARVLERVAKAAKGDAKQIAAWHADRFAGSFVYRQMRGLSTLSMHAFGCAVDLDASENMLGDKTPFFTPDNPLVKAFEAEGWTWGGRWPTRTDAMHFQAASV